MLRLQHPLLKPAVALLLVVAFLVPGAAEGAKKKKKKASRPTPTPTAAPEYYGPPAPADKDYSRAAGTCLLYEPGHHVVVAEVGEKGRAFRIDADTVVEAKIVKGGRVRILYTESPDGPLARKILPGPVESPQTTISPGPTPTPN